MNERPSSLGPLLAVLLAVGALVLTIILAWPEETLPPRGPDLPGPGDSNHQGLLAHERSAHRETGQREGPESNDENSAAEQTRDRGARAERESLPLAGANPLEVELVDGFERLVPEDRPRYALILRPLGDREAVSEARVVQVHSGLNQIEALALGDWSGELAGLPILSRHITLRRDRTERIVWDEDDLTKREFSSLRVTGIDSHNEAVTGLRLALAGRGGSTIDIAPIRDGSGDMNILIGPIWEGLLVTGPGWAPVPLREATTIEIPVDVFLGHDPDADRQRGLRLRRGLRILFR